MNEHAGPASALSVLIIGLFAILLHDRSQPPPSSNPSLRSTASRSEISKPARAVTSPLPASTRSDEVAVKVEVKDFAHPKAAPEQASPIEKPVATAAGQVKESPQPVMESPLRPKLASKPQPGLPKAPFTVVKAGEKLADVASRVYGTEAAAEPLWRANRDQVASLDATLATGTLLRTP